MSFTKTSEGRVFFKNANNDDAPRKATPPSEAVMPKDNTQIQILLLLKSLNTKMKTSREGQSSIKKQLGQYKETIKDLENKAATQETNYIDLEQKVASKQNEANKKSSRVEGNVKKLLKQIEEAKQLVQELESKDNNRDESLLILKSELEEKISGQGKNDTKILQRQKTLEEKQKEQGEKMVGSVAAYVALTKRVSEAETKNEALDNKIEDASSEYIKLDRKIDKAIEDRNRILRKVDRIEQAVLETRDALNAKAMVLLTDQGAVAGVNMPQVTDEILQTDPSVLNRRIQEEALMPWWRKPVRIQGTSLVLMMLVVLLLGWIMSEARHPAPSANKAVQATPPTISLYNDSAQIYRTENTYAQAPATNNLSSDVNANLLEPSADIGDYYTNTISNKSAFDTPDVEVNDVAATKSNYGITIHKGHNDPTQVASNDVDKVDINNDTALLEAFENNQDALAEQLNQIEPSNLTTEDMSAPPPAPATTPKVQEQVITNDTSYIDNLKNRINADPNLSDIAKKIESQAFKGVPEAQHDMGAIYVAGHGKVPKNMKRAILWFTEASNNGVANAKYNLGVLHHQGLGVEQNITKAMKLYEEAANIGHPEAQYNLGIANIEGIGVTYSPSRAAMFFEMAANKNVAEASYNLGLIYENGLLGETSPDAALAWYKRASDQGSPEASTAINQLSSSLGLSPNDVTRIIEKFEVGAYSNKASSNNVDNYLISQIQNELMRRGLYPGPVDGMSGPMTENAIKSFQKSANLNVNGKASSELLSYLRASL